MASRPAIICQKDVTRIVKGYAAAGITMGMVVRNGEAVFLPLDEIRKTDAPSALERWQADRDADKARGDS